MLKIVVILRGLVIQAEVEFCQYLGHYTGTLADPPHMVTYQEQSIPTRANAMTSVGIYDIIMTSPADNQHGWLIYNLTGM